jgi:hypothetical protein
MDIEENDMEDKKLEIVFNFVIPPSSDNKMPGAGFLCEKENYFTTQDITLFNNTINQLSLDAQLEFDKEFTQLDFQELSLILKVFKKKNLRNFNNLIFRINTYYYSNDRVLKAIGIQSRPPFPDGNFVIEGDLLLFEEVYLRGNICRECPSTKLSEKG